MSVYSQFSEFSYGWGGVAVLWGWRRRGLAGCPCSQLRSCLEIVRQVMEAAAAIRGPEDPMEQRSGQAWRDGT